MDNQDEAQVERKSKKAARETLPPQGNQTSEDKSPAVKVTFEGEAAKKILKFEAELKDRLSKPDLGKILGSEILSWSEKRWAELLEEHTDIEYFFSQIRKYPDKSKSIKLLKAISEKLRSEMRDSATPENQDDKLSPTNENLDSPHSEHQLMQ